MKKMKSAVVGGIAALAASTVLVACGDAPEESNSAGDDTESSSAEPTTDFLP